MLGPDPAILFWTPIALLIIVLAVGFALYNFPKKQNNS